MKVFLSWSGHRSKLVADALSELLPGILQPIQCWMSENDLGKGKPWFDDLAQSLSTTKFAVVCVTKENLRSPWMLWETGFLSSPNALGDRRVAPLAIGFSKSSLDGPLAINQGTDATRDDILRLTRAINQALPDESRILDSTLNTTFDWGWPRLAERFKRAIEAKVDEKVVPQASEQDQVTEILAILRQQQRESADIKSHNLELRERLVMMEHEIAARARAEAELRDRMASQLANRRPFNVGDDVAQPLSKLVKMARRPANVAATDRPADVPGASTPDETQEKQS